MFCIAAFIVFAILAIFSASYRPLAKQAWHCVVRRISFKPCDINFADEVKGRLIGKLIIKHPQWAKFLNRWMDWLSFAFIILSIWSAAYVLNAGLNLWVYDTCNPSNVESCSLSGEACGIDQSSIGLIDAVKEGKVGAWALGPFTRFGETVLRIPDRLRTWEPTDYYSPTATTYYPVDETKPYAVEMIDPNCTFCRKLYGNIKEAGFERSYNLSYVLYPIPDTSASSGYKFPHSPAIARTIEATKLVPLTNNQREVSPDWQLLEKVFGQKDATTDWQTYFNIGASENDVKQTLRMFLTEIGYAPADINRIMTLADSEAVAASLLSQKKIVEDDLRTIKIPTILFGGRRYDRAVDADTLKDAILE